jgi:hypothetical protein
MKLLPLLLSLSCGFPSQLLAENSPATLKLTGIINLPGHKAAFLERPLGGRWDLQEAQREGDVEVMRIHPETGSVDLRLGGTNASVTLDRAGKTDHIQTASGSLELVNAQLDLVLGLYARCKGRTLLRSPRLPSAALTTAVSVADEAQAALALEKGLAEHGIVAIPDGEKFVMVVPQTEAATVKPGSSEIKVSTAEGSQAEPIPVGMIDFRGTEINQVAQIYADLLGRKLDQTERLAQPTTPVNFRNEKPLTRQEVVYALETLFKWQGLKVVPVSQDLARLVPASEAAPGLNK